ncbi:MAG: NUDIX domain-containing protein [Aequorivita sp.]
MPKESAGILLYTKKDCEWKVLLAHPGGPFWAKKDLGAWSIPKGEMEIGESIMAAALREAGEELGIPLQGKLIPLISQKQQSGKWVHAAAMQSDFDPTNLHSNTFSLEWPPHSGKINSYPEIDKVAWFSFSEAKTKILKGQIPFIIQLENMLIPLVKS